MEHDNRSEQQKNQDAEQAQLSEHIDAANSGVPNVMATLGLGKMTRLSTTQIEEIIFDLDHPEWSMRVAALRKLGKLGTQAPVAPIVSVLADEHEAVRSAAVRALGSLGRRTPIEPLLATLNDTSWHVRAASIMALGKQRERVSGEPFIGALSDTDETVRAAAAWALGKQGERAPLAPLVAALHDPAWSVREAAVLALGERGGAGVVGPLLTARMDEDSAVRAAAETTLQQAYPEIEATSAADLLQEEDVTTADRRVPLFDLPFQSSASVELNANTISQPLNKNARREALDSEEIDSLDGRKEKIFSFKRKAAFSQTIAEPRHEQEQQRTQQSKRRHPVLGIVARGLVAAVLLVGIAVSWLGISHVLRPPAGQIVLTASQDFSTNAVNNIVWSHDGQYLASVGNNGIVSIWNIKSDGQQTPGYVPIGTNARVLAMNWSSTNLQIVAMVNGQLKLIQIDSAYNTKTFLLPTINTQSNLLVAWSSNGKHFVIATKGGDNRVELCDFSGDCQLPVALNSFSGSITALALSSDGTSIATANDRSGSTDKNIQVWNKQGQLISPFTNPTYRVSMASPIIAITWSPQNDELVYESNQGQLAVWTRGSGINNGNTTLNNPSPSKPISGAALSWSPDGKRFASVESSKQIQIWDATSGDLLYTSSPLTGPINDLAWSPDENHLALTSADGTLHIWGISG